MCSKQGFMKILQGWVFFLFLGKTMVPKCGWSLCSCTTSSAPLPNPQSRDAAVTFFHVITWDRHSLCGGKERGHSSSRTLEKAIGHNSGMVGIPGKPCTYPTFPEQLVQSDGGSSRG